MSVEERKEPGPGIRAGPRRQLHPSSLTVLGRMVASSVSPSSRNDNTQGKGLRAGWEGTCVTGVSRCLVHVNHSLSRVKETRSLHGACSVSLVTEDKGVQNR